MVVKAGILFVVEVMQKSDLAPQALVASELTGIRTHASFHSQGMLA
jgi:H+/Cl- antiporter ClcA